MPGKNVGAGLKTQRMGVLDVHFLFLARSALLRRLRSEKLGLLPSGRAEQAKFQWREKENVSLKTFS